MRICIKRIVICKKGITLIELLVVISIIGILVIALGFSYQGWMARYRVESTIKQIQSDMINANIQAMTMLRAHSATFDTVNNNYSVFDGAVLLPTYPKPMPAGYFLNENIPGGANTITFNTRGTSAPQGSIWITPALPDSDYDCVIVAATRINIGRMEECDAGNAGNECCPR